MVFGKLFGERSAISLTAADFRHGDAAGFWRWYARNADVLRRTGIAARKGVPVPHDVVGVVGEAVRRFHPDLAFEMGMDADSNHELVISAEGVVAVFPMVLVLVNAAPVIQGHRVTAFRQRRPEAVLSVGNRSVSPEDVGFVVRGSEARLDVVLDLQLPPQAEQRERAQVGFLLLDCVLGEYDVATALADIEFRARGERAPRVGRPLPELAAAVDAFNTRRDMH